MLSTRDYAGSGGRIREAVNGSGRHEVFLVTATGHQYGYTVDGCLDTGDTLAIRQAIRRCDVIHFKGDNPPVKVWRGIPLPDRPVVVTVGGSAFRRLPGKTCRVAMGLYPLSDYVNGADIRTALTPDLNYPAYLGTYTQHCINAEAAPYTWKRGRAFIVGHSPSARRKKGTDALIIAVDKLKDEGVNVRLDIIENVTNSECVERKKRHTVFFDQVADTGFYGMSAVEAMQFGVPVMAYVSEMALQQSDGKLSHVPVINCGKTPQGIYKLLKYYIDNRKELETLSVVTKWWADKFHGFTTSAKMWNDIYDRLT